MDLSDAEEAMLPLPETWMTHSSLDNDSHHYRNVDTGIHSDEHPFIVTATNMARRLPLPPGWVAKVVDLDDGSKDVFYMSERSQLSMWDPPLLRECLAQVLLNHGYHDMVQKIFDENVHAYNNILSLNTSAGTMGAATPINEKAAETGQTPTGKSGTFNLQQNKAQRNVGFSFAGEAGNDAAAKLTLDQLTNANEERGAVDTPFTPPSGPLGGVIGSPVGAGKGVKDRKGTPAATRGGDTALYDDDDDNNNDDSDDDSDDYSDDDSLTESEISNDDHDNDKEATTTQVDLWNAYREKNKKTAKNTEQSHSLKHSKPPRSTIGIRALCEDIRGANERIHDLLVQVRLSLCGYFGIAGRVMSHDEGVIMNPELDLAMGVMGNLEDTMGDDENNLFNATSYVKKKAQLQQLKDEKESKRVRDLVLQAANIINELHYHPEYIIDSIAMCDRNGPGMSQIAFTALCRLLHPYSTDQSLTTLFLLQSINYQVSTPPNVVLPQPSASSLHRACL